MDDVMDMLYGIDKKNEIINLWYEITFLRLLMCHALGTNAEISSSITDIAIKECREAAQKVVQERFPAIKIDFSEPSEEQKKKKQKHMENLKFVNKLLGLTTSENAQESPCCTRPDSSESPVVSPPPSNEA